MLRSNVDQHEHWHVEDWLQTRQTMGSVHGAHICSPNPYCGCKLTYGRQVARAAHHHHHHLFVHVANMDYRPT